MSQPDSILLMEHNTVNKYEIIVQEIEPLKVNPDFVHDKIPDDLKQLFQCDIGHQ